MFYDLHIRATRSSAPKFNHFEKYFRRNTPNVLFVHKKMLENVWDNIFHASKKKKTKKFLFTLFAVALYVQQYAVLAANPPQQDEQCVRMLDFVAVLDMSGSVGISNWRNSVMPAARTFFEALDIGEDTVHTGLVYYDDTVAPKWDLSTTKNRDKTVAMQSFDAVANDYRGGGTATGRAITHALDNVLKGPGKREVPRLMLVITDGRSQDNVNSVSQRLRNENITTMVIGVAGAVESECRTIAGCERQGDCPLYVGANWNTLVDIIPSVMANVCKSLPKDAECNEWSDWGPCSATCGEGITSRERKSPFTITPARDGDNGQKGKTCEEQGLEQHQEKVCTAPDCAKDAICGNFGPWSCCTKTCGGGTMERYRMPWNDPPAEHGGKTCEQQDLLQKEEKECNTEPCAQNAVPGDWGEWSECGKTCGYGTRKRHRGPDKVEPANGGLTTIEQGIVTEEKEICHIVPCGPCASQWAQWTQCSQTCGDGLKSRHRHVKFDYPTYICNLPLYETKACVEATCPSAAGRAEEEEPAGGGGANTAAIAGGVIGGAALLAAAGGGAYYYSKPGGGAEAPGAGEEAGETPDQEVNQEETEETVDVDPDSEFWQS